MDPGLLILSLVAIGFLVAAYAHTSVGLGGGSSYTAIQSIAGFPMGAIPLISLALNLLATILGSANYIRGGHFSWSRLAPFLLGSIPCAWLGGLLVLPQFAFLGLLLASLLGVLLRILLAPFWPLRETKSSRSVQPLTWWLGGIAIGAILGFVAGAVGIGGGIYLVPIIRLLGRGNAKEAAACGTVFIFINSAIGLSSRVVSHGWNTEATTPLLILVPAVAIGAWFGSKHGALQWSRRGVERTLCLVIAVACLLLIRKLSLLSGWMS